MIRYLEVFGSSDQMEQIKTVCKVNYKVEVTPLEYRIVDPKGRALHYTHLELKGKEKHVKRLIKQLSNHE